jgi:SM-20-related protein
LTDEQSGKAPERPRHTADRVLMASHHDARKYRDVFTKWHRIHIAKFLRETDALRIHDALAHRTPWDLTVIHGNLVYDVKPEHLAAMDAEHKAKFEAEVYASAAKQYEGRYGTKRLSDHGEAFAGDIPELTRLTEFLNDSAFLSFIRQVTGEPKIEFADAQATCYGPGDFLHRHYDTLPDKKRIAAYVLNFTPRWLAEWGGLLGFLAEDGHVIEAYTPAWNALNLLHVTQLHYVSHVAPFAAARRYSVTGWLRSR